MLYTPGIEVSAPAVVSGDAEITHTVTQDGNTEMKIGGHSALYLLLSEEGLQALNTATAEALKKVQQLDV